jgi:transposase
MKTQKEPWRKKSYEKATLELKLFVVDQIQNGQISTNFASKKYDVPRTTIGYWIKKYSTLVQQNTGMSKLDEIKKLRLSSRKHIVYSDIFELHPSLIRS